jgi:hypothetical protein
VDQLLQGKRQPLPAHQRPTAAADPEGGSSGGQPRLGGAQGTSTDVTLAQQRLLLQPALSNASDVSLRYCLAEHYLAVLTPLGDNGDALLVGSLDALRSPSQLAQHSVTHVVLLCCGPEVLQLT